MLRGAAGMTQDEYEVLLGSYGVESSKELTEGQLTALCTFLEKHRGNEAADKDKQRKRLIAAACAFCADTTNRWEEMSEEARIEYAKGVACRAAGMVDFNKIGLDRLRSLTYAFQKRKRDMDGVVEAIAGGMGR